MYNLSTTEVLTINNQTSRCITGFTITFTKQTQTDSKATSGSTQHSATKILRNKKTSCI